MPDGEPAASAVECRRMIIGPGVNQPDPFPGYDGFVGWQAPARLKDGTLLVTFSAGYWHTSPATPLPVDEATLEQWRTLGVQVDIDAPTGGRAMIVRSTDGGNTWSKPATLIDTPADDRHPTPVQLPDGTVLCSFVTYFIIGMAGKDMLAEFHTGVLRSLDGGRTWENNVIRLPSPFISDGTDGPIMVSKNGSALMAVYGLPAVGEPCQIGLFGSMDSGRSWELLSIIETDHEMTEPGLAELADGRLVLITRPQGDICWSEDGGRTWTKPVSIGIPMVDPQLIVLQDGTLLCLHGSYVTRTNYPDVACGVRAVFSTDGGETWVARAPDQGFAVDASAYGYSKGIELPDGSVFVVYQHTGGHKIQNARNAAIWHVRLRIRPDHSGIDLLPY